MEPKLGNISGFTNYNEEEHYAFSSWVDRVRRAFRAHGFTPFYPAPLEYADNILLKGGISKQIYGVSRLQDESLTDLALPFDRTVPLALFVAKQKSSLSYPYKRYEIANSFRGERPQAGRFRAFIQADVDIIDRKLSPIADFECIATVADALTALNVGSYVIYMNHISIAKALIARAGISPDHEADTLRILDKLDKVPAEKIFAEIKESAPEASDEALHTIIETCQYRGPLSKFKRSGDDEAFADLDAVHDLLIAAGHKESAIQFCPGMVRGLDYYTGIVFETFLVGKEKYGSIASGGRYSNLIDSFSKGKTDLEGVGFSLGMTRLFDIMTREKELPLTRRSSAHLVVACRTPSLRPQGVKLATRLRAEGHLVDLFSGDTTKIQKQLTYTDKKGIPLIVMVMDESSYVVKHMEAGEQTDFTTVDAVVDFLQ